MELNLIKITEKKINKVTYFGVNDKHYDAMLACGGSILDDFYEWDWLGSVFIEEDILNEQGYFYKEK